METLSIKVAAAKKARLAAAAKARGVPMSRLIEQALDAVIREEPAEYGGSCYDLVRDLFETPGKLGRSGQGDLSTNKKHLADFGRKSLGGRAGRGA